MNRESEQGTLNRGCLWNVRSNQHKSEVEERKSKGGASYKTSWEIILTILSKLLDVGKKRINDGFECLTQNDTEQYYID